MVSENQKRIWSVVQLIPEGKVATYGQVADLAGLPGRARLVGKSLQQVPENGFDGQPVPWHRVINSQGKISLPVGSDCAKKQSDLLLEEQVAVLGYKVRLRDFQWQPDLTEMMFKLSY